MRTFAREVGRYLDLRKELHKEVERLVADEPPEDLAGLSARELERYYFAKGSARAP